MAGVQEVGPTIGHRAVTASRRLSLDMVTMLLAFGPCNQVNVWHSHCWSMLESWELVSEIPGVILMPSTLGSDAWVKTLPISTLKQLYIAHISTADSWMRKLPQSSGAFHGHGGTPNKPSIDQWDFPNHPAISGNLTHPQDLRCVGCGPTPSSSQ